jgi:membrane carboxypeptidase/penicillin-binding protein PbpC
MRILIKAEWQQLQESIDKLEFQIASSNFPTPTFQMCNFLIVGEDHRFYYHPGVDPLAICRAFWKTAFCGSRQGASTIAMQLVRTITGRYERT